MILSISDTQARVLIAALDHYSRMGMGQLWTIAETLCALRPEECKDAWDIRDRFTVPMQYALFGYPPNASAGICSPVVCPYAKIAYDMLCVIRRPFSNGNDVWSGQPLHTYKQEPLAKVLEEDK